jgi:hypothetical protein
MAMVISITISLFSVYVFIYSLPFIAKHKSIKRGFDIKQLYKLA